MADENEKSRSFLGLILIIILQLAVPALVANYWYKKTNCSQKPLKLGIIGYICSFLLQKLLIYILGLLAGDHKAVFYTFATAFPGIFEEAARFVCFNYFIFKKNKRKNTSVNYGIGHGGMVSVIDAVIFSIKFFFSRDKEKTLTLCLINAVEKISKFFYNISLSILVYKGLRDSNILYFFLAVIFHFIIDFFELMGENEVINDILAAIIIFVITLASVGYAYYLYIGMKDVEEGEVENDKSSDKIEKINDTDNGKSAEESKS